MYKLWPCNLSACVRSTMHAVHFTVLQNLLLRVLLMLLVLYSVVWIWFSVFEAGQDSTMNINEQTSSYSSYLTNSIRSVLSHIVRINKDNNFSFDLFNRKGTAFGSSFVASIRNRKLAPFRKCFVSFVASSTYPQLLDRTNWWKKVVSMRDRKRISKIK